MILSKIIWKWTKLFQGLKLCTIWTIAMDTNRINKSPWWAYWLVQFKHSTIISYTPRLSVSVFQSSSTSKVLLMAKCQSDGQKNVRKKRICYASLLSNKWITQQRSLTNTFSIRFCGPSDQHESLVTLYSDTVVATTWHFLFFNNFQTWKRRCFLISSYDNHNTVILNDTVAYMGIYLQYCVLKNSLQACTY